MSRFPHLKIFTAFSYFCLLEEDALAKSTPITIDPEYEKTDGALFIKNIVNGKKMSSRPAFLMFTAPYRLCRGGCNSNSTQNNFELNFPIYIGTVGKAKYRDMYPRDYSKIIEDNPNAPFKTTTARPCTTPCYKVSIDFIVETTESTTTTEATTTRRTCPFICEGCCIRKTKLPQNTTDDGEPTHIPKFRDIKTGRRETLPKYGMKRYKTDRGRRYTRSLVYVPIMNIDFT